MSIITITIAIEDTSTNANPEIDDIIDIVAMQVKEGFREGSNATETQAYWYEVEHD